MTQRVSDAEIKYWSEHSGNGYAHLMAREIVGYRTTIANQAAEIERLRAQIAAMGTVTNVLAKALKIAADRVELLMPASYVLREARAALEALKGGDATSQPLDQNSEPAPQSHDQACGAESANDLVRRGCRLHEELLAAVIDGELLDMQGRSNTAGLVLELTTAVERLSKKADLHGRGKFGGPLAERYVEQAGGTESDGSDPGLSHAAFYANAESNAAFVERMSRREMAIGYSSIEKERLVSIARRATKPDPRDAQIAKLREALEAIRTATDVSKHRLNNAYFLRAGCSIAFSYAASAFEETRGES